MSHATFQGRRVVVGVCGGIAAYKACDVISRLRQCGAQVRVIATRSALEFVGETTLRSLSGCNVASEMFGDYPTVDIQHISLAEFGEVIIVVAATANVIAKVAAGICDDLLTTTICAASGKVIFAPAMNWRMWENPINLRNVQTLKELGYGFVGPDCGYLACGESGQGRLCPAEDILDAVDQGLGPVDSKLKGRRVLITCGPTREWIDPVRFISNPSSGKMGFALAQEAMARGAEVTIVRGPTDLRPPWGAQVVPVETTREMLDAVLAAYDGCDVLIGAAAPVDFTPAAPAQQKIKKLGGSASLELVGTPDILTSVSSLKGSRVHVGFAAESENLEANAQAKLAAKALDLICANDITAPGSGFGADTNEIAMYSRDGLTRHVDMTGKREVAIEILDEVETLLSTEAVSPQGGL